MMNRKTIKILCGILAVYAIVIVGIVIGIHLSDVLDRVEMRGNAETIPLVIEIVSIIMAGVSIIGICVLWKKSAIVRTAAIAVMFLIIFCCLILGLALCLEYPMATGLLCCVIALPLSLSLLFVAKKRTTKIICALVFFITLVIDVFMAALVLLLVPLFFCHPTPYDIEALLLAAEQGDIELQCELGYCYFYGRGVVEDKEEAVKWFRKVAEQGNADAQVNLGQCYRNGWGVAEDKEEAIKWYHKSAEQGNVDAQYNLGNCYFDGEGVPEDKEEAVKWYHKAAEQGDAVAQYNLGNCYFNGEGVPQDTAAAVYWLRKSAEQELKRQWSTFGKLKRNEQE